MGVQDSQDELETK